MSQNPKLQRLNKAYFVRSKLSNYPVPEVITNINDGLCAVLFETRDDIKKYFARRNVRDLDQFEILRIGSIYDRMREFANLGFVGIYFFKNYPITFANRISEFNSSLPTLGICELDNKCEQYFFGAAGSV